MTDPMRDDGATGTGRVLVAVSGSGRGSGIVEAGAHLAAAFGLPWHVLFVETPRSTRDPSVSRRAADALGHAVTLGATVSTEPASGVAEGIAAHLSAYRAAHLVIGAPRTVRGRGVVARSFLPNLLSRYPNLSVHIAPIGPGREAEPNAVRQDRTATPIRHYLIAIGLVIATLAVCGLLRLVLGGRPLNLLFLFPVIAAAARYGLRPALMGVITSVLCFDFFLLQPLFRFEPLAPVNLVLWAALGGVAIYTSLITEAVRNRAALSDRSAQESAGIVAFAQALARASTWDDTARAVCEEFAGRMNAQAALIREKGGALVCAASVPPHARWGAVDQAALDTCWATGVATGAGTQAVSAADWRFEPLKTSLGTLAVLGLVRSDGRDPVRADRTVLFATLATQAALAHERLVLEDRAHAVNASIRD